MSAFDQAPDHPDDDLLADLGDGLLDGPQTRVVEAHVVGCESCLQLLERSEALVGPLHRLPVEEMPADVVDRLTLVLADAAAPSTAETPAARPADTGPTRILKPMTAAGASRMVRPGSGARRQQRGEERDEDRSFRLMKYGRWAAAAVLVVGVGAGAVTGVRSLASGGGSDSAGATAGDSAAAGRSVTGEVLATGTNYDKAGLKGQVEKLVQTSRTGGALRTSSLESGAGSADASEKAAQPQALASGAGMGLADETTLAACLTAIGQGGQQPVAVDLARYQDREAAVIVLEEPTGQLDVWVVARTCAPGADGTIAVETIQP